MMIKPNDSSLGLESSLILSQGNIQLPSSMLVDKEASKHKKERISILERQQSDTLTNSLINQERKVGIPKVSTEQNGKYGKKVAPHTSVIQLHDELRTSNSRGNFVKGAVSRTPLQHAGGYSSLSHDVRLSQK